MHFLSFPFFSDAHIFSSRHGKIEENAAVEKCAQMFSFKISLFIYFYFFYFFFEKEKLEKGYKMYAATHSHKD